MDQVVVTPIDVDAFIQKDPSFWTHPLLIPSYLALISILVLVVQSIYSSGPVRRLRGKDLLVAATRNESNIAASTTWTGFVPAVRDRVQRSGGSVVFLFQVLRLLVVLTLLGLAIFSFVKEDRQHVSPSSVASTFSQYWGKRHKGKHRNGGGSLTKREWLDLTLCLTHLYAAFLALVAVASRGVRAPVASLHLSLLLLGTFSVYAYRNIWPLLTFTLSPVDASEGPLLWVRIGLLAFAAIVIPLLVPRQYIPIDPKANYDHTRNFVKRSFKHLDTFSGGPKRHIFWGILAVFRREYIQVAILLVLKRVSFSYLETRGEGAVVRPWVWITCLFLGPALGSIAFQWCIFIGTGTIVRVTAIVTQLVFEHALRIRVKAEISSSPSATLDATPDVRSEASTPDSGSVVEIDIVPEEAGGSSDATQSEQLTTTASSMNGKREEAAPGSGSSKGDGDELGDSNNLVGKMNNLVSADLENLVDGRDFLLLSLSPQFRPAPSSLLTKYFFILGWSAFVGMAVMVALFPVPGTVAGKIQKVQKETVKCVHFTVRRMHVSKLPQKVGSRTQPYNLFGWEPKIAARLAEKREQELRYIKLRQILNLINGNINFFIPIITMVVTYVTYTAVMKRALTPSAVFSSMAVFDLIRDQLHTVCWTIPTVIQARVSIDRVNDFLRDDVIGFQNASFTWSNDHADGTTTPSRRRFTLRVQGELLFKRGCFNLIIGPTGSGKTSLLMALLGEMHFVPMSPDSWYHLPREGGVSYAAAGVVARARVSLFLSEEQDNILFGAPYDEGEIQQSLFDAGDKTEVGEKGLTLSGGQKARVTLARAVYSSSQILILDDVGAFPAGFVVPVIDIILTKVLAALDVHTARWIVEKCLNGDLIRGRTILLVTHNVAMVTPLADYVVSLGTDGRIASRGSVSNALKNDKTLEKELAEDARMAKSADGKLILAEEIAEGNVSWDAVFAGGMLLCNTLMTVQTWFMGYWAEQYVIYPPDQVDIAFYLTVYGLILLAGATCYTTGYGVYVYGAVRASRAIHRTLIESVLGTTLRWLDTTPASRVITRVTQDIRALDGPVSNPSLVPWLGRVYMKAQIAIKREMSNCKGARARATLALPSPDSAVLFAAGLAAYLILCTERTVPSLGYWILSYHGHWIQWLDSLAIGEERISFSDLERLHSYVHAEQEPKPTKQGIPPAYWPASGDLRVEKLSARYSLDSPKVLHDMSFHIKSGERVGVGCGSRLAEQLAAREAASPNLLSGSLRENLDPFSQYDDATLNGALARIGASSPYRVTTRMVVSRSIARFRAAGATSLSDSGKSWQLARAIVIDTDKVMVLDAGRIVEFDKPSELLKMKNGRFRSLVDESGDRDLLYSSAGKAQHWRDYHDDDDNIIKDKEEDTHVPQITLA
ncbi:hypothetical protein H4582DRAFT_2052775 [Lactarius indigo]|nr:hypothetical protein H4582DRAFT_2052775 [Lactarius indigo]